MSIFTQVSSKRFPRNTFDVGHSNKITGKAGILYPIFLREMMPGTDQNISNTVVCRLMPQKNPTMHKCDITVTHHFVPLRLLFPSGYEEFFATPIPNEDTPVWPYFSNFVVQVGSLSDHLGLPTQKAYDELTGGTFDQYNFIDYACAEYHAAYQKIYNDWYRDQNLVNGGEPYPDTLNEGLNSFADYDQLRRRAWQHDYFTAALPFAQKGDAVEIPIAAFDDVPVVVNATTPPASTNLLANWEANFLGGSTTTADVASDLINDPLKPDKYLFAQTSDLSQSSTITINALRWANKLQEFLERNARGGTRYIELIRSHFGVRSSDARLQRSEFLGWSKSPIVFSEVLSTANTVNADDDVLAVTGSMYGHGIGVGKTKHTKYYAEEHGIFMSLLSIRPKTSYSQGIPRRFSRKTALDFPWPEFAHLGEQEILNREIFYCDTDGGNNDATFGYMQRYAEMKYENDRVAGAMRTNMADWHMGRIFQGRPNLNQVFIECKPSNRTFNVVDPEEDQYILYIENYASETQILSKHGIPSL